MCTKGCKCPVDLIGITQRKIYLGLYCFAINLLYLLVVQISKFALLCARQAT